MKNYNNPLVTYDEIVDAIKAIIECSISSNYLDDYNYLNVNYSSPSTIDNESEQLLMNSIKSLLKSIESSSSIIRKSLNRDLEKLEQGIIKVNTEYLIGQEKRKLAAQARFIEKLNNASINISTLLKSDINDTKEVTNYNDVDTNKVFSDFEKKVVSDFPVFFKEELSLAQSSEDLDAEELNNLMAHKYTEPEEIKEEISFEDRLDIIEKAIIKARELGDQNIIDSLEKKYEDELKSNNDR